MVRPSNKKLMTGKEITGFKHDYPWDELEVGDYFKARYHASSIASVRNRDRVDERKYLGVMAEGLNFVVRVE